MGGKGSKVVGGGEKGKKGAAPPAPPAEDKEPTTNTEAGNEPVEQSSVTGPERIEGQAQEQYESTADMEQDYVEAVVAKASELGENEMREVDIGETKALLVHQDGKFSAIGHKCTHYGAPLAKGYLGNGRVRCPWHGACFNIQNGDIEEFPGLDGVPCFQVRVDGDDVLVKADKMSLANFHRAPIPCGLKAGEDARVFVIVGGGPASVECAETLRREGFKGRVVIINRESDLPYDRPKLSKAMHLSAAEIALRSEGFYEQHGIELKLGKEVTGVDIAAKKVMVDDETFLYDKLLLATGSKPRTLPVPGFELRNVFLLREPAQANEIAEFAAGKKVVVIGTSFIGMEVAAYLSDKASSVSCIGIAAVPFERVLGESVGKMLQDMHEENGIKFHLSSGVKEIVGNEEGAVSGVTLPSGETLDADLVVAGVGVVPATDFLKDSGLPLSSRGELIVDKHMKAVDDVFGAGDIVKFPLSCTGEDTNIGHWQIAHNHGRIAARNMLGKEETFNSIPYFWTVQYGKSLRYCGHALTWDDIIYEGSTEERKFIAYYTKDDKVLAVASLNFDPAVSTAAELMYQGRMPSGSQIKENPNIKSYL